MGNERKIVRRLNGNLSDHKIAFCTRNINLVRIFRMRQVMNDEKRERKTN